MSSAPVAQRSCPLILLVDANKSGLAARKSILEEQGWEVQTATLAEEALRRLEQTRFDLVVTDHRGARLNGVALIQELRRSDSARVPVILLCHDPEAMGLTEKATGADLVLDKSVNEVAHLVRGVKRLLGGSRRKPPLKQQAASRRRLRQV